MDGSEEISSEDEEIIEYLKERKCLVLINKKDLEQKIDSVQIRNMLPNSQIIKTSLINGDGIEEIENAVEELVYGGEITQSESMMVNNVRHINLLTDSFNSLEDALQMAVNREALDFIEIDVKNAYELTGEIIGESVNDDIINEVFARFCLGK